MASFEIDAVWGLDKSEKGNARLFTKIWGTNKSRLDIGDLTRLADSHANIMYKTVQNEEGGEWTQLDEDSNVFTRLYTHPWAPKDENYMVALACAMSQDGGTLKIEPLQWLMGAKATILAAYQMSCCAKRSALMYIADNGGKPAFKVIDNPSTHEGQKQLFKPANIAFAKPGQLAHMYAHITGHDLDGSAHQCGHGHAPIPPVMK